MPFECSTETTSDQGVRDCQHLRKDNLPEKSPNKILVTLSWLEDRQNAEERDTRFKRAWVILSRKRTRYSIQTLFSSNL